MDPLLFSFSLDGQSEKGDYPSHVEIVTHGREKNPKFREGQVRERVSGSQNLQHQFSLQMAPVLATAAPTWPQDSEEHRRPLWIKCTRFGEFIPEKLYYL